MPLSADDSDRLPHADVPPLTIGHYRVIRELGRGGQGTVYLAEDTRLSRRVALKVLSRAVLADPAVQLRFQREAAVTAKLDHPAICTVYDAGQADGAWYIAMRFVEGETLAERINVSRRGTHSVGRLEIRFDTTATARSTGSTAPTTTVVEDQTVSRGDDSSTGSGPSTRHALLEILALIEKAARAVHVAHEAGVIHRDIKPSNIMLCGNEPVILDFGLARDLSSSAASVAESSALVGTPAYMSPEQVRGDRDHIDRRTDVYALGVTLFECLTLRRPFEAATRDALYQAIVHDEPPNPRHLNSAITNEMRIVLGTAIEKDPNRRYQTALALAEDLRRIRQDEPILARPPSLVTRVVKFVRRNRTASTVAAALALALSIAGAVWWFQPGAISVTLRDRAALVRIDDGQPVEIAAGGTLRFRVMPGPHSVEIMTVAPKTARVTSTHDDVHVPRGGGEISIERFVPSAEGVVQFESTPPGATVVVATEWGEDVTVPQPTPTLFPVLSGRHRVRFTLPGFETVEQILDVAPGARGVPCRQTWATGSVVLSSDQDGTRVEILAADPAARATAIRVVTLPHAEPIPLPAGRYALRARLADHESLTGADLIEVRPGQTTRRNVWLQPWVRVVDTSTSEGDTFLTADVDGDGLHEIVSGGLRGVLALTSHGDRKFDLATATPVTHLIAGVIEPESGEAVLIATSGGEVARLARDGMRAWTRTVASERGAVGTGIVELLIGDVIGDARPEVIVALRNGRIEILDGADGKLLLPVALDDDVRSILLADVEGKGRPNIVANLQKRTPTFNVLPTSRVAVIDDRGNTVRDIPVTARIERLIELPRQGSRGCPLAVVLPSGRVVGIAPDGTPAFDVRLLTRVVEMDRFDATAHTADGIPRFAVAGADGVLLLASPDGPPRVIGKLADRASVLRFLDLDGDGSDELVVGTTDGALVVYEISGGRRFETRIEGRVGFLAAAHRPARPALAVASDSGLVTVFEPHGERRMETRTRRPSQLALDDLDSDGENELVVAAAAGRLTVLEHDDSRQRTMRAQGAVSAITLARSGNDVRLLAATRQGVESFEPRGAPLALIPTLTPPDEVAVVDLDHDGQFETVVRSTLGHIEIHGPGGGPPREIRATSPANLVIADLDGDGRQRVIAASTAGDLEAFDAQGTPRLLARGVGFVSALAVGDLDGDGQPEIITSIAAGRYPYGVMVIDATGRPRFTLPRTGYPGRILLRDLDGDGRPEILITILARALGNGGRADAPRPSRLLIVRGDGSVFRELPIHEEQPASRAVDLDGDGPCETIVGVRLPDLGPGLAIIGSDGSRRAQVRLDSPLSALDVADIDGDGALDIAVLTARGELVALRRDGQVIFQTELTGDFDHVRIARCGGAAPARVVAWSAHNGAAVVDSSGRRRFQISPEGPLACQNLIDIDQDGRNEIVTGNHLGELTIWNLDHHDRRVLLREAVDTGLVAAWRNDEARAAEAFATAGLAWLDLDPRNSWQVRLDLAGVEARSAAARAFARRVDQAIPNWVAAALQHARTLVENPRLRRALSAATGASEADLAPDDADDSVLGALTTLAERTAKATHRRDPRVLATLAIAQWMTHRDTDARTSAAEAEARAAEIGGRTRDEVDLALRPLTAARGASAVESRPVRPRGR